MTVFTAASSRESGRGSADGLSRLWGSAGSGRRSSSTRACRCPVGRSCARRDWPDCIAQDREVVRRFSLAFPSVGPDSQPAIRPHKVPPDGDCAAQKPSRRILWGKVTSESRIKRCHPAELLRKVSGAGPALGAARFPVRPRRHGRRILHHVIVYEKRWHEVVPPWRARAVRAWDVWPASDTVGPAGDYVDFRRGLGVEHRVVAGRAGAFCRFCSHTPYIATFTGNFQRGPSRFDGRCTP